MAVISSGGNTLSIFAKTVHRFVFVSIYLNNAQWSILIFLFQI